MSHAIHLIKRLYGFTPASVVHVGANSGQEVADLKRSAIRPVVLVEPLDGPFNNLVKEVGDEPGFHPVKACLSDTPGRQVTFHIASNGGQSSSYFQPGNHLALHPNVRFEQKVQLTTSTLDDVFESLAGRLDTDRFDYIGVDTQGAELDILRGGLRCLQRARFVFCEVSYLGLYKNSPDLYEIIAFLRERDFDLCHLIIGKKGWGDALFMRRGLLGGSFS
jgi:FkbM family methyltransferase